MFLTWVAVGTIACLAWGRNVPLKIGLFVFAGIAVAVFFDAEVEFMARRIRTGKARAPMFTTGPEESKMALLPHWRSSPPTSDDFGQVAVADYDANVLAVVLTGVPGDRGFYTVEGEVDGFSVRGLKIGRPVTFPRMSNVMVVILLDGTHKEFSLGPRTAWRFCPPGDWIHDRRRKNVLREARELLGAPELAGFDAFIAGYEEPLPPRPIFHNEHGTEKPPMSPWWHLTEPRGDQFGNRLWADYEDNLLVVVVEWSRIIRSTFYHPTNLSLGYFGRMDLVEIRARRTP